jgi:hypothetical protein
MEVTVNGTWKTTGGGSGGLVLVLAAVILAGSGAASAAVSALVTILIITGSVIGAAVLGGIGWLVYRARQDRPGRPIAARPIVQLPPAARPGLPEPCKPAIEAPRNELHLHFHGMSPAEAAEAIRRAGTPT